MENLVSKLLTFFDSDKSIELTKQELECLFKVIELYVQIELLESYSTGKEFIIEENTKALKEIFKGKHFEGFEEYSKLWI